MAFNIQAAKQAGYSDQEIQAYMDQKSGNPAASVINSLIKPGGLVGGPGGIDMTKNVVGQTLMPRVSQTYNQIEQGQLPSADQALGALTEYGGLVAAPAAFEGGIIPAMLKTGGLGFSHGITTPGANVEDRLKQGTTEGVTAGLTTGLFKLLAKALPFLTKKNVANMTTKATENSTEKVDWNNLQSKIKDSVKQELGDTRQIRYAVNNTLAEKTPQLNVPHIGEAGAYTTPTEGETLSPTNLLDWRRQISARGGGNWLQRVIGGNDIQDKVDNIVRRVVSGELHSAVPETVTPDKVYSFYSKIHGDVPTWAKRITAGVAADQVFKKTGLGRAPGDILGFLLGGKL